MKDFKELLYDIAGLLAVVGLIMAVIRDIPLLAVIGLLIILVMML